MDLAHETKTQIASILVQISSITDGAISIITGPTYDAFLCQLCEESWAPGYVIVANVILHAVSVESTTNDLLHESIKSTIQALISTQDKTAISFDGTIKVLQLFTSSVPIERQTLFLSREQAETLLRSISTKLRQPTKGAEHGTLLILLASLLRAHGHNLFITVDSQQDERKFFLLICALSANELRSSLAKLVTELQNQRDTSTKILKVASCFDILRIVCLYLITSEKLPLGPDEILALRDNFSAAFGETL